MIETLVALFLAHVLADFVLQTDWMARNKLRPEALVLHAVLVMGTAQFALGQVAWPVLILTAIHICIDVIKARFAAATALGFLVDQLVHFATLVGLASLCPDLWMTGRWATQLPTSMQDELLHGMLVVAGGITAVRAGGFVVGLLMKPYASDLPGTGLTNGGALIGLLERSLIFLFVLIGQPTGIGFLIGAKSILRFGSASEDQRASEYVIIGTLASFGWALGIAYLTQSLGNLLPPLEFVPTAP